MIKKNPVKLLKKELKAKMENRLLVVMSICIVGYIAMLFANRGFLQGGVVLYMRPVLYSLSGAFAAIAVAFAIVYFVNRVKPEHRLHYRNFAIAAIIVALCTLFVAQFNVHGIKVLAIAVTIYLVDAIVYYSYYVEFMTRRKLLWILFGAQFVVICAAWFLLLSRISGTTMTLWSILSPARPITEAVARNINIGLGIVLGLIGLFFLAMGIFFTKNKKNIQLMDA